LDKKILILVAVIAVFGFGSVTALLVPVGLTTNDNVKIYTKTQSFMCEPDPTNPNQNLRDCNFFPKLFCDEGDTVLNGYGNNKPFENNADFNISNSHAITVNGIEGWEMFVDLRSLSTESTFGEAVIVCAKVVQNNIIGGLLLEPDTTALFLAYGIANAIWIAPTMAGLAAGIYLTKNKWKR